MEPSATVLLRLDEHRVLGRHRANAGRQKQSLHFSVPFIDTGRLGGNGRRNAVPPAGGCAGLGPNRMSQVEQGQTLSPLVDSWKLKC